MMQICSRIKSPQKKNEFDRKKRFQKYTNIDDVQRTFLAQPNTKIVGKINNVFFCLKCQLMPLSFFVVVVEVFSLVEYSKYFVQNLVKSGQ